MSSKERFADKMEFPPAAVQPNVFPLSWQAQTKKMEEVWDAAQREVWDPKKLPWDTFDVTKYSWEEREAIAYWWTLLSVFDASAPPVFAEALIKTYEVHEEDPVRRCFFSVTRDEQNHEQMCGLAITKLLEHPDPLTYEPKTELGKRLQKNAHWLYYNGSRYWEGYKKAVPKYSLAVLFSSFLMGEVAAATIFKQMADGSQELVFREAFRNIGRDEGRHMAICMALMERDYPQLDLTDRDTITKQVRAGYLFLSAVLFEPPMEFWDLPADFIDNQREGEAVCRQAGFAVPEYEAKKENWRKAILNLKGVLDRYDIPFPAIPEVGISGKEITDVEMEDIIPVF
ncbi:diiron oxygenase [Caenispirillum bisanense]|uniref:p-aminobenzoate N-oxygenase AurF n=1 Tax=Caenispirillum bisanense TaxID=414052 RepID=A0A286GZ86_9PROT|nr:diiron oxygenase [Caenispirillum bisanense]SOE00840.1 P-aminobenzoate N-oxygenase AurF [Caenispirillum bisanense]